MRRPAESSRGPQDARSAGQVAAVDLEPRPGLLFTSAATPEGPLGAAGLSLATVFEQLAPKIRRAPMVNRALPGLRRLGHRLPLCSPLAFEIRLQAPDPQVDLALRLPRGPIELGTQACDSAPWQWIAGLTELAAADDSAVRAIDLEFDLPAAGPSVPVPRLFLELHDDADQAAFDRWTERLLGPERYGAIADVLHRCSDALPPRARMIHLGSGLSRASAGLRVVVTCPAGRLTDYLLAIGWRWETDRTVALIGSLSPDRVDLALDLVGNDVRRIGFECFIGRHPDRAREWRRITGKLAESGLCADERAAEFAGWDESARFVVGPAATATTAGSTGEAPESSWEIEAKCFPSHVKVACAPDGAIETKAYMAIGLRPQQI